MTLTVAKPTDPAVDLLHAKQEIAHLDGLYQAAMHHMSVLTSKLSQYAKAEIDTRDVDYWRDAAFAARVDASGAREELRCCKNRVALDAYRKRRNCATCYQHQPRMVRVREVV